MGQEAPKSWNWLWIVLIIVVLGAAGFWGWKYWQKNSAQPATNTTTASAPSSIAQGTTTPTSTPTLESSSGLPSCNADTQCGDNCVYNGESYPTKTLAGLCWINKNLDTTVKADGETPSNRYCYNDDPNICETDGGLYSWADAYGFPESCNTTPCDVEKNQQGLCPNGWHVVVEPEWVSLTAKYSYDELIAGGTSQFNAILVGYRNNYNNIYDYRGLSGHYWSSTNFDTLQVWYRSFYADSEERTIYRSKNPKTGGAAVRCVKNY